MKKFEYKCSGGNGDYYKGTIEAIDIKEAEQKLIIRYHNILELGEKMNFCKCDNQELQEPHLDDGGYDWCVNCKQMIN